MPTREDGSVFRDYVQKSPTKKLQVKVLQSRHKAAAGRARGSLQAWPHIWQRSEQDGRGEDAAGARATRPRDGGRDGQKRQAKVASSELSHDSCGTKQVRSSGRRPQGRGTATSAAKMARRPQPHFEEGWPRHSAETSRGQGGREQSASDPNKLGAFQHTRNNHASATRRAPEGVL